MTRMRWCARAPRCAGGRQGLAAGRAAWTTSYWAYAPAHHAPQVFECAVGISVGEVAEQYFGTGRSEKAAKSAAAEEAVAALAAEPGFQGKHAKAALRGNNAVAMLNRLWQKVPHRRLLEPVLGANRLSTHGCRTCCRPSLCMRRVRHCDRAKFPDETMTWMRYPGTRKRATEARITPVLPTMMMTCRVCLLPACPQRSGENG